MNKRLFRSWVAVATVLSGCLAGCGGGGGKGGSGGIGTLALIANFTPGTASGPTGLSEEITITDPKGNLIAKRIIDSPTGGGQVQANFNSLANENLYVQAVLYPQLEAQGTASGTINTVISGGTASQITTAMATQPVSVKVTPATATIAPKGSIQLEACAEDISSEMVFQSQAPTWSVSPGSTAIVGVSSTGVASGLAGGDGTVDAQFGTISGSLQVVVSASVSQGDWTVMIYMNSANDLDIDSFPNITQLESIAQTINSPTRFVIQWKLVAGSFDSDPAAHTFNGTRRYVAVNKGLYLAQDMGTGVDMGSVTTLQQFVNWTYENYPAQHYALVLWDHGNGWQSLAKIKGQKLPVRMISLDQETGNYINVWQLPQALSGHKLDIFSCDACLMQMLEVEDELAPYANYMVCGEDNTPAPGYPYDLSFGPFVTNPASATTVLSDGIVSGFFRAYTPGSEYGGTPLSQSVVDLSKVGAVTSALGNFSNALIASGSTIGSTVDAIRNASLCYDSPDGYYYYDLEAIANRFAASSTAPAAVKSAASALSAAVTSAVVMSNSNAVSSDSHGISIEFGNYSEFNPTASDYANLNLATETTWSQFLNNSTLNP